MNKKLVVMIRVRMEVEKNTKKCCVDKDLDTDVGADIALDYQHKMSQFQVLCKPSLWCRIEIH